MTLHFELDQEVNNCKDCAFCCMEPEFGELECVLSHVSSRLRGEYVYGYVPKEGIPDWCHCVKVEDEEYDICEYYRQQDGRCRATRDCEWEGCNGDRSKCPHNKINVL